MEILNTLPLQINLLPNVISNEVNFNIEHNIKNPKFVVFYQKFSFEGDKFQAFDIYKKKLLQSKQQKINVIDNSFKLKFNNEKYESTMITIYSKKPYLSPKFYLEILAFPYGENFVLGYCKLGKIQPLNFYQENISKKEKLYIKRNIIFNAKDNIFENSKRIVKFIYKKVGVQGSSRYITNNSDLIEYFEYLKSGDNIQCGQVTYLLKKIFSVYNIYYREVRLFRYYPPIDSIIVNRHSVLEIYEPKYNKWILIDGSYGLYIVDNEGVPLNVFEIKEHLSKNVDKLKIIYLTKKKRFHNQYTASLKINRDVYEYDYFSHFNCVSINENNQDIYTKNININNLGI